MKSSIRALRARLDDKQSDSGKGLRRRLEHLNTRTSPPPMRVAPPLDGETLADFLGGQWQGNSSGQVLTVRREFPNHRHGNSLLGEFYSLESELICLLANDTAFRGFHPDTLLFMDTETTGLSGGAGTYVFLIGIGFFENQVFRTHQFFLPSPQSEQTFLQELTDTLQPTPGENRFHHLVSFNGKSYDLNLLDNRFVLQRLENPFRPLVHLDLLNPSRLLWEGCFENCRLQTLEEQVLGFKRSGDIPSALIPRTYFDFLHHGQYQPFRAVLEHNRLDLLSMVTLLLQAARLVRQPDASLRVDPVVASRVYERHGQYEQAVEFLETAGRQKKWQTRMADILLQLARIKKKLGQTEEVLSLSYQVIERHPCPPSDAFEEIAKILEHRQQKLHSALQIVDRALQLYPYSRSLLHRRHRLKCRIAGKKWY